MTVDTPVIIIFFLFRNCVHLLTSSLSALVIQEQRNFSDFFLNLIKAGKTDCSPLPSALPPRDAKLHQIPALDMEIDLYQGVLQRKVITLLVKCDFVNFTLKCSEFNSCSLVLYDRKILIRTPGLIMTNCRLDWISENMVR